MKIVTESLKQKILNEISAPLNDSYDHFLCGSLQKLEIEVVLNSNHIGCRVDRRGKLAAYDWITEEDVSINSPLPTVIPSLSKDEVINQWKERIWEELDIILAEVRDRTISLEIKFLVSFKGVTVENVQKTYFALCKKKNM